MHRKVTYSWKIRNLTLATNIHINLRGITYPFGVTGLGFTIDEIIQAWNETYEAKKWQSRILSFRVEPLLKRRVSKIYHA